MKTGILEGNAKGPNYNTRL